MKSENPTLSGSLGGIFKAFLYSAFWRCNSVIVDLLTFPKRRILLQGKQILVFKCGLDFGGATLSWIEQQEFTNVLLFFFRFAKMAKKSWRATVPLHLNPCK